MLQFELIVVIVCLGTETDFLDFNLDLLGLYFLGVLLLQVDELGELDESAHGRFGIGAYFHEVNTHVLCHLAGTANR